MAEKLVPRPAATLLLLREGARGPEVFLLQRNQGAAFLAGAYVFPGGALDPDDHAAARRVVGITDAEASARLGLASGGRAYWVAAVRECFEEAGILIARRDGAALADEPARSWRARLNANDVAFSKFLEKERLFIPGGDLAYFGHWITAPGRARRFDTRFFAALAPPDQAGAHDEAEMVASAWFGAREALERHASGEFELVFATRNTIADLARFATAADVLAHLRALPEVETNRACWAIGADGTRQLYRRRDAPYFEIHWADPEETGDTSVAQVPGVPKRLDARVTRIIAPNPGAMTGPGTNTYLVGENDLAVIDPGPAIDSHVRKIVESGQGRIKWVLCTHTHLDHSPAAAALKAATGAQVIGRPPPPGSNQDQGFAPDLVFSDGDRLVFENLHLRAIHTPGHASNHLCYLLEETKMLFTGDHVMQGSTVVINPPDGDMRAYLASLERLLGEDLAILAPGHGYLIGAPHAEARRLIAHRLAREEKVVSALHRLGAATIEELLPIVYDDVSPKLHPVAARSLSAHLEKLAAEGRASAASGRYRVVQSSARRQPS